MRFAPLLATLCLASSAFASDPTLTLSTHLHSRYALEKTEGVDDVAHEFRIRRARLATIVEVDGLLEAELDFDLSDTPALKDAALELHAARWLRVKAGQFKKPFSRLSLTGPTRLALISRGHGNELISGDLSYGGRDLGVMASGRISRFRYAIGVFNGAGTLDEFDTGKDVAARFEVRLGKPARIGVSGSMKYRNAKALTTPPVEAVFGAGIDGQFRAGPVRILTEVLWAQNRTTLQDDNDLLAAVLFGYVRLKPTAALELQPIVKVEVIDPDLSASGKPDLAFLGGINLVLHKSVRVMVQGEMVLPGEESSLTEHFSLTVQLAFDDKLAVGLANTSK